MRKQEQIMLRELARGARDKKVQQIVAALVM
jgi:hypothetical protein